MHETVLIILVAVVALIVVVVLLGMRYLRADDDDAFDVEAPAGHNYRDDLSRQRGRGHAGDASRAEASRVPVGAVRGDPGRPGSAHRPGAPDRSRQAGRSRDVGDSRDASAPRLAARPLERRDRDWADRDHDRDRGDGNRGERPRDDRGRGFGQGRDSVPEPAPASARTGSGQGRARGLDELADLGAQPSAASRGYDDRDRGSGREGVPAREGLERRSETRLTAKPAARRAGNGQGELDDSLPAVRPRPAKGPAKGKRDGGEEWPSNEWDELSDVDYWAELASDKPLTAPAPPVAQTSRSALTGRVDEGRSARVPAEHAGFEQSRSGRGGAAHRASRRETDTGSQRSDRPGGDRSRLGGDHLRRPAFAASDRPPMERPAVDRVGSDRSLPMAAARNPVDPDDPLTSPSFPRIETDDSRSYRRSRSPSAGELASAAPRPGHAADPSGYRGPDFAAASHDPYRPLATEISAPRGYPAASGYPASAGAASGGYSVPAVPHALTPPGSGGYLAASAADGAGYSVPASNVPGYAVPGAGYPAPPVNGGAGFDPEAYSVPRRDDFPAQVSGSGSYASPTGGYPAGLESGGYLPAGASNPYAAPSSGISYGAGTADQPVGYSGYPAPLQDQGPHSGSYSGPHHQPEIARGYPADGFQAGYPAGAGYAHGASGGFPTSASGVQSPESYPGYPAPASSATSDARALPPGFQPGFAGLPGGFGPDYTIGQTGPAVHNDAAYQPYDPPGYRAPAPGAHRYAGADPYAVDPYGYSPHGNGGG